MVAVAVAGSGDDAAEEGRLRDPGHPRGPGREPGWPGRGGHRGTLRGAAPRGGGGVPRGRAPGVCRAQGRLGRAGSSPPPPPLPPARRARAPRLRGTGHQGRRWTSPPSKLTEFPGGVCGAERAQAPCSPQPGAWSCEAGGLPQGDCGMGLGCGGGLPVSDLKFPHLCFGPNSAQLCLSARGGRCRARARGPSGVGAPPAVGPGVGWDRLGLWVAVHLWFWKG